MRKKKLSIEELFSKIEQYVAEQRPSPEGGLAEITDDDVSDLYDIVKAIVRLKCEPSYDYRYPFDFQVCDTRKLDSHIYPFIPKERDYENPLKSGGRMDLLIRINQCISNDLAKELQLFRYHEHERQEQCQKNQQ